MYQKFHAEHYINFSIFFRAINRLETAQVPNIETKRSVRESFRGAN